MKTLTAFALILSCCVVVSGQCVIVSEPEPSSRNAKITVLLNGKPAGNAKIIINLPAGQGMRSLVTDSHGTAALKDLPEGASCITATGGNGLSALLCLEVSERSTKDISSFQMTLAASPQRLKFDENIKRMEQRPPAFRLRTMAGVVLDPLGAVIPKAEIQIYKHGSYPGEPVKTLKTDDLGRLVESFEPGVYTIIVRKPGFQTQFQGVEISPDGKDEELRYVLQVAATDTCE
jgi:hypothetical protein